LFVVLPLSFTHLITTAKDADSGSPFVLPSFPFHVFGAFDFKGSVWLAGFLLVLLSVELK